MTKITRKTFLKLGAASAVLTGGGLARVLALGQPPAVLKRRGLNVLMITCDQERSWLDFPRSLEFPNRRRLLERSMYFRNFHVNAIACGPARSVLYTGRHIQHTLLTDNPDGGPGRRDLDPTRTPTLGQRLQDQGYYTAYKGKWDLTHLNALKLDDYTGALRPFGFDEFNPREDVYGSTQQGYEIDDDIAGDAARWLTDKAEGIAQENPWFLSVNFINPHDIMFFDATGRQSETRLLRDFISPMKGAPERAPYMDDLGYDLPQSFADDLSAKPSAHRAYVEDGDDVYGPIPLEDEAAWRRYQNYYFNCMRDVDRHIGTVMDALERSGERDNTIIIYTADHGEMAGAHGQRLKGPFIYKENVQVPLAIDHPDIGSSAVSNALACSLDIVPTVLSFAGLSDETRAENYPDLKGFDLSGMLTNPSGRDRRRIEAGGILLNFSATFASNPRLKKKLLLSIARARETGEKITRQFPQDIVQFDLRSFYRGIFDGRYRFARYFSPDDHHRPEDKTALFGRNDLELYDVMTDPLEMTNLGANPDRHVDLIMGLNAKLNGLIDREVGLDDGTHMPGDPALWRHIS